MTSRTTTSIAPILVTGGTGTLGSQVVERLLDAGRDVRVLARHRPEDAPNRTGLRFVEADLATGEGVDAAVAGAETIVHTAGSQKGDEDKARHLVRAAKAAGTRHLVYISVVGADRIPVNGPLDRAMFGYFDAKHGAERIVAESGLPWTTLRATQFHDLTFKTVEAMAKLPIVPVPAGWHFQPIDSGEVADRLVDLALGTPAGLVPEIGGPQVIDMADLVRSYLNAIGKSRRIVRLPLPGSAARAFRDGANLTPDRAVGQRPWGAFLTERLREPKGRRHATAGDSSRA